MKSNPINIVEETKQSKKLHPILFYGSEDGLISKLIKSIYDNLSNDLSLGEIIKFDHKNEKEKRLENLLKNSSLFSKTNFIVLYNPQERLIKELENINYNNNILIINAGQIKTNSKITKHFNNHNNFVSVPCYQLDKNSIKKNIDIFLEKLNIKLKKEVYWFLVENISEESLILDNELLKLQNYINSSSTIEDVKKLIIQKNNYKADNLFFMCATGNYKLIIQDVSNIVKTVDDSYEILRSIKKFHQIITKAVIDKKNYNLDTLVKFYLPRYLFMKKELFKEILKKINVKKITKISKLLQKTELLLRKNSMQHLEIIERFLLNLAKILK